MGIAEAIAGVSAITGIVGAVMGRNEMRRSASAQREANEIQAAQQQTESLESRRQAIREERVRRAQILAMSEGQGTSGSSGEAGAVGALSTNLASRAAQAQGRGLANQGINRARQSAATAEQRAGEIGAWTNTIQSSLGGFASVFDSISLD